MMSKKIPFLVWEVVKILCDAYPETLENCENSGRNHVIDHCMWPRRDIISLEIVKNSHALFSRQYCYRQDTPPTYYDGIRFLIEIPSRYNKTTTIVADRSSNKYNK